MTTVKELRDYQETDIVKTWEYMLRGIRRGIIHYATGGGKTITGIEFNKRYFPNDRYRTIFLAKDRELIFQPYRVYKQQWPGVSRIIQAGTSHVPGLGMAMGNEKHNAPHARVIVGSVPTLLDRSTEPLSPAESWKQEDGKRIPQSDWSLQMREKYEGYLDNHTAWAAQDMIDNRPITLDDITVKGTSILLSSQSHRSFLVSSRMDEVLAHGPLSLVIYDECFPAGTLIDGRPIETLEAGDEVWAFSESTQSLTKRRIKQVFHRRTQGPLVRVRTESTALICTYNHPIYTQRGWIPAGELHATDTLLRSDLLSLRQEIQPEHQNRSTQIEHLPAIRSDILWRPMSRYDSARKISGADGRDQPEICLRADEEEQPYAQGIYPQENVSNVDKNGAQTQGTWREWKTYSYSTDASVSSFGQHRTIRICRQNRVGLPSILCHRHRISCCEIGYRSRWGESHASVPTRERPEERRILAWERVDSVEIFQRGRDGEYSDLLPDGYVYNLEVEEDHTYLANGVVVHNCHHAPSDGSLVMMNRIDQIHTALGLEPLKILGFTATPLRADNRALSNNFDWIYASRSFRWMQAHGYLAPFATPIRARILISNTETKQVKYVDNWAEQIVETWLEKGESRATIAYLGALGDVGAIDASKRLRSTFSAMGVPAAHIDGIMCIDHHGESSGKEGRQAIFDAFAAGEIKILCNYGVLIEGVDLPITSCMLLARPANAIVLTQMIGRMLRLHPNKKDALLIDFTGGDLTVVTAGTLMGYRVDPATGEYVEELLEDDEEDEDKEGDIRSVADKGKYIGEGRIYEVAKILSHSTGDWFRDDSTDILSLSVSETDVLVITPPHYGKAALVDGILKEAEYGFLDEAPPWREVMTDWERKRFNTFRAMTPEQLEQYTALFQWIADLYGNFVLWHVSTDSAQNQKEYGKPGPSVVGRGFISVNPALDVLENEAVQYGYSLPKQGDWTMKKGKTWKYKTLKDYPMMAQKLRGLMMAGDIDMSMKAGYAAKLISHLLAYRAVRSFYHQAEEQIEKFSEPS